MRKKCFLGKIVSVAVAFAMLLTIAPAGGWTVSAESYNPSLAVQYASEHWNDGVGACARFVSNCLSAGGCSAYSAGVSSLRSALINGGWGTEYLLTRNGNYIYQSDNVGKVAPGDPIFFYCTSCGSWEHVEIAGNYTSYVTGYGHNVAKNNTNVATFMDENGHTGSGYIKVYAFHMNTTSTVTNAPGKPALTVTATDETQIVSLQWALTSNTDWYDVRIWYQNSSDDYLVVDYGISGTNYGISLSAGNYCAAVWSVNWDLSQAGSDLFCNGSDTIYFTVSARDFDYVPAATEVIGNKIYALYNNAVSHTEAEKVAQNVGGNLASIENQAEQTLVEKMIKDNGTQSVYWLGGSDSESESAWAWDNGAEWNYTNWQEGEPNNNEGWWGDEDYLLIYSSNGLWNDCGKDNNLGFILEFDIADINSCADTRLDQNNHAYTLYKKYIPWEVAEAYCEYIGGRLATVTSKDENDIVESLANEAGIVCFLGATDKNVEGVWQWIDTGEIFYHTNDFEWVAEEPDFYTNWATEQPDNYGECENYLMIYPNTYTSFSGQWNDIQNCFVHYPYFICEQNIGDISGDGIIDAQDLSALIKALLNASEYGVVCDANGDGTTDIRDLVRLKKHLADDTVTLGKEVHT